MSRNAHSNKDGKFDDISLNRVNVHGFDDFGTLQSNSSKLNQLGGIDKFDDFFNQIRRSEISLADLTILTNFRHFHNCMHFWTYLKTLTASLSIS